MKISMRKLNISLARCCKSLSDLRCVVSPQTLTRVKKGEMVTTATLGKIAKALGVDPEELLEQEEK